MKGLVDAWSEVGRRAESQHGIVTSTEMLACGLSPGQVESAARAGRLRSISIGVWQIVGSPTTREASILGAVAGVEGEVWASHRTAAWLWGVPVHGPSGLVEVTRRYGASVSRGSLLIHRSTRVLDHHITSVRQIPCLTVPRTIFDLARATGPRVFDRAVEHVLRHHLCTVGSLHQVLAEMGGRGRPGTARMRAALASRDQSYVPKASELTAVGRGVLRLVPGIEWEVELYDERGYIRRVDGFVRDAGLVIEFDGPGFHDQPSDVAADEAGDARLHARGFIVERLRWTALTRTPDAVVTKVLRLAESDAA